MSDIPEDIMRAARACASVLCFSHIEGVRQQAVTPIARAILAERERCAQIAREHVFDGHAMAQATEFGRGCHETATRIAAAIRSPERAGE